jgi:hypothetical protein
MEGTGSLSGPSVKSFPDYSHKSQELNLFGEGIHILTLITTSAPTASYKLTTFAGLRAGKPLHSGAEVLPVCGAGGAQESDSDNENLEQYDAVQRWKLTVFGILVTISVTILALIILAATGLLNGNQSTNNQKNPAKNFYTLHAILLTVAMTFCGPFGITIT